MSDASCTDGSGTNFAPGRIDVKRQMKIGGRLALVAAATGALACFGPFAAAQSEDAPYGRELPGAVEHVAAGGVLVVACDHTTTSSATLVNATWMNVDAELMPLDRVIDGSIVNNGSTDLLCLRLDDGAFIWIAAGESLLAGPSVGGYKQGCLCKCGKGTVFIEKANCGGICSNCNSQGPCLDPTNSQTAAGFTDCTNGWGPSSN
jgi:hypothetical protein